MDSSSSFSSCCFSFPLLLERELLESSSPRASSVCLEIEFCSNSKLNSRHNNWSHNLQESTSAISQLLPCRLLSGKTRISQWELDRSTCCCVVLVVVVVVVGNPMQTVVTQNDISTDLNIEFGLLMLVIISIMDNRISELTMD